MQITNPESQSSKDTIDGNTLPELKSIGAPIFSILNLKQRFSKAHNGILTVSVKLKKDVFLLTSCWLPWQMPVNMVSTKQECNFHAS